MLHQARQKIDWVIDAAVVKPEETTNNLENQAEAGDVTDASKPAQEPEVVTPTPAIPEVKKVINSSGKNPDAVVVTGRLVDARLAGGAAGVFILLLAAWLWRRPLVK